MHINVILSIKRRIYTHTHILTIPIQSLKPLTPSVQETEWAVGLLYTLGSSGCHGNVSPL